MAGCGFYLLPRRIKEAPVCPCPQPGTPASGFHPFPGSCPSCIVRPEAFCYRQPQPLSSDGSRPFQEGARPSRRCSKHLLWLFISFHYQALRECHVASENKTKNRKSWRGGAVGRAMRDHGSGKAGLLFPSFIARCCFSPEGHIATFPQLGSAAHSLPLEEDRGQQSLAGRMVRASNLHR